MKSLLFFLLLSATAVASGEPAQTLIATDLKQQAFTDAPTLAKLAAGTPLDFVKRQGGWMQVKTTNQAMGWVKMSSIKLLGASGAPGAVQGDSGMAALWNVAVQGRSGNSGVTVATGVRGLTLEEMKAAQPAPQELSQLESYAASAAQAQAFASAAQLLPRTVDELAAPKPEGAPR